MQVQAWKNAQKAIYISTLYSDELVKRTKSGAFGLIYKFLHIFRGFRQAQLSPVGTFREHFVTSQNIQGYSNCTVSHFICSSYWILGILSWLLELICQSNSPGICYRIAQKVKIKHPKHTVQDRSSRAPNKQNSNCTSFKMVYFGLFWHQLASRTCKFPKRMHWVYALVSSTLLL